MTRIFINLFLLSIFFSCGESGIFVKILKKNEQTQQTTSSNPPDLTEDFSSSGSNTQNVDTTGSMLSIASFTDNEREISISPVDSYLDITGLMGYWKFNEAAAGTVGGGAFDVEDFSGNNHHGVTNNNPTFAQTGELNNSLLFDDPSDTYVEITNTAALSPTSAITLSALVYPTTGGAAGWSRIISKSDGGTTEDYGILYENDDQPVFRISTSVGGELNVRGVNITPNKWSHIVGTYDGSMARIYVNGQLANEIVKTGNIEQSGQNLSFGANIGSVSTDREYSGRLDEVMIFNRALTSTEIASLSKRLLGEYGLGQEVVYESQIFDTQDENFKLTTITWRTEAPISKQLGPISLNESLAYTTDTVDFTQMYAYYPLSGTLGATVPDSSGGILDLSGNNRHATLIDADDSATYVSAPINTGVVFDGIDYITLPSDNDFAGNSFTISLWFYLGGLHTDATNTNFDILTKNNGGSNRNFALNVYMDGDNQGVSFIPYSTCSSYSDRLVMGGVRRNAWNHITVSFESGVEVNALLNGQRYNMPTTAVIQNCGNSLTAIGNGGNAFSSPFFGNIAEVGIWMTNLSFTQMESLYKRGAFDHRFQVRSCSSSDCSGALFQGPDGTSSTYFTADPLNTSATETGDLSLVTPGQYYQYRVFIDSLNSAFNTNIESVNLSSD